MEIQKYENNRNLQIDCTYCGGDGYVEHQECSSWPSMCCGGCYVKSCCPVCLGEKILEPFDYETEDNIRMLKALEYRKEKFRTIIQHTKYDEDQDGFYQVHKLKKEMKRNDMLHEKVKGDLEYSFLVKNDAI